MLSTDNHAVAIAERHPIAISIGNHGCRGYDPCRHPVRAKHLVSDSKLSVLAPAARREDGLLDINRLAVPTCP